MNHIRAPGHLFSSLLGLTLLLLWQTSAAAMGVREAATALERKLSTGKSPSVSESFSQPVAGSRLVLSGESTLEQLDGTHCRRTLELLHDQPFERHGLRITSLSRRSVQDGPCQNFASAMTAQAEATAKNIAEQIGADAAKASTPPNGQVLVAQLDTGSTPRLNEAPASKATVVALTVREKAIIRDAPARSGEKLSRADKGTQLKAWRIAGNPDWFVLDGGLRYISATVVDVSEGAHTTTTKAAAPARGDTSRVRLKVMERAVLRNAPSFKGKKVAQLAAGVERLARKVPNISGWFQLVDSESRYPLYIHESVVSEKSSDKRL